MKSINKRQKGVSIIEVMMVMGIIALIIISVLAYFRTMTEATNVRVEAKNLRSITTNVEMLYAFHTDYFGLNNDVIKQSGVLPNRMTIGTVGTNIGTAWGKVNAVTFNRVAPPIIAAGSIGFQITYNGMSDDSCADFASGLYQEYDLVTINGINVATVPTIINACALNAVNTVAFTKTRDR